MYSEKAVKIHLGRKTSDKINIKIVYIWVINFDGILYLRHL